MKLITEKEYKDFVEQRKKINELILSKAVQLALIQYKKVPKGDVVDYDFEESDRKLIVQYQSYSCGDINIETYYLPLEFLFDESYPEKYKLIWQEEKRRKEEERIQNKIKEDEKKKQEHEAYERNEYERLKLKFENKK